MGSSTQGDDEGVVGGWTVGVWVLLVIAVLGWVGAAMEVVVGEYERHNQSWCHALVCLAWEMPEHFRCVRWGCC